MQSEAKQTVHHQRNISPLKSKHSGISLLASAALCAAQFPTLASNLPLYCKYRPTRGLTPDQEARCAQDPNAAKEAKKKVDELQPPSYPFTRSGFLTVEPTSGKQIPLALRSQDGSQISFDYGKDQDIIVLKPVEIVSWKSANTGSGTDASSAVSVAVAGALFFWPMMLAAPFMVKNYTITGFQIEYIDPYGKDVSLDFATIESPRPTMELLRFSTGLTAGTKRGLETTKPLYEAGLQKSMRELEALKKPLLEVNNKKPWCSTIRLGENQDSTAYKSMFEHISALRRKLDLPPIPDMATKSTDQQWEAYLDSRPGLRQWAATYKQQADTLKKC